jgi:choice-of-anchor B domain-containing protein
MKKIVSVFAGLLSAWVMIAQTPCENGMAGIYPCDQVDLWSHIVFQDLGCTDNTNDIWGWTSPVTGREYALMGCANGTSFIDITSPATPVYIGFLPTQTVNSLWRDIKTYNNYAFIVAEAAGHGLQVFDLLQLDNVGNPPQTFSVSAHYSLFGNAHNVAINPDLPFAYCVGSNTADGGLHIVNIADPLNPQLAGIFSDDGYTHDCQNVIYTGPDAQYQGREIVFAANEDAVTVVDATDKLDCQMLSTTFYAESAYTHQGWLTSDQRYFLVGDELDEMNLGTGTRTHIFDVSDLDNVEYVGFYESESPAIDHNMYVIDHFVYQSNYRSGLRILDAVRVDEGILSQIGFFDLVPQNDNATFSGSWSNYPYFGSGNVVATSMYDGLFVLRPTLLSLSQSEFSVCADDIVVTELTINADLYFPLLISEEGLGTAVATSSEQITGPGTYQITLGNLQSLPAGAYFGQILLTATNGEAYHVPVQIEVSGEAPVAPVLSTPADAADLGSNLSSFTFTWEANTDAINYTFELSEDAAFNSIIEVEQVSTNSFEYSSSLPVGEYFWRVRMNNTCGEGPWSTVRTFQVIVVGVTEQMLNTYSVSPNPVRNVMIVGPVTQDTEFRVMDLTGRVCQRSMITSRGMVILDVAGLSQGAYILTDGLSSVRFVKE